MDPGTSGAVTEGQAGGSLERLGALARSPKQIRNGRPNGRPRRPGVGRLVMFVFDSFWIPTPVRTIHTVFLGGPQNAVPKFIVWGSCFCGARPLLPATSLLSSSHFISFSLIINSFLPFFLPPFLSSFFPSHPIQSTTQLNSMLNPAYLKSPSQLYHSTQLNPAYLNSSTQLYNSNYLSWLNSTNTALSVCFAVAVA